MTSRSGAAAKRYFDEALQRADYYQKESPGHWFGKGAEVLGLSGEVSKADFIKLIDNLDPRTGDKLNPRVDRHRIVGWDISFHAPKSFSLSLSLGGDERLIEAFRQAVRDTMGDIEAQTQTRVRVQGQYQDRATGNLVWSEFLHLTSRPIGGIPDPHCHIHAYTFNTTFDPSEQRHKAAKISEARRDMPLHQARFHSRLAELTRALGYTTRRTQKGWEIAGINRSLIDKFSRRTAEIDREAARRGIKEDHEKDKLGALTREGKSSSLTDDQWRQAGEARLTAEEKTALKDLGTSKFSSPTITARESVDHAIEKLFARDAVVRRNRLLTEAIRYGTGQVSYREIEAEFATRDLWERNENGTLFATSIVLVAGDDAKKRAVGLLMNGVASDS